MPKPCTAVFEQMTDVGNGRFCKRCNKTVHDVSQLPDGALQVFLNTPDRVCMQLHEDQLGRDISLAHKGQQELPLPNISVCLMHDLMPGTLLNIPLQDDMVNCNRWLTGFLIDETNQLPLSHAIISIGPVGLAFSDEAGWFKIFVPEAITARVVPFTVSVNTYADSYREVLKQSIEISASKVQLKNNDTLKYQPFTLPTSVKITGACTFIQTSA